MTISVADREFFIALGERIATLRRARDITQVQLAEALGVSQQTLQSYEVARRRIPASAMPALARALSVSIDELFGQETKTVRGRRGPAAKLAPPQFEVVARVPRAKQQGVSRMIETVTAQPDER